jgi:hypothetical protein
MKEQRQPRQPSQPSQPSELRVESQAEVLLQKLDRFYDDATFEELKRALTGEHRVSLRVLDWLVTNYAKKKNIVYTMDQDGCTVPFIMWHEYKCQLTAYSKQRFDMFCRRDRVEFRGLRTTVGQLNFFKWAIRNGVLRYARDNHDAIEQDMLASIQHRFQINGARPEKRAELSKAAMKTCTSTKVTVQVRFT